MRKKIIIGLSLAALAIGMAPGAQASAITKVTVHATGANEAAGTGAMGAIANGTFTINETKGTICVKIKTRGLTGIAAAHIHKGARGVDGGPVVTFDTMKFNSVSQDCVKAAPKLLADIAMNPSMYYFNVHTKAHSNGAVRGQLNKR